MSNNHRMEAHFKYIFNLFNDAPTHQKQAVYALSGLIFQQEIRFSQIATALGASQIYDQTDIVMEFMARAAVATDDLAIIDFNAADFNVKHGFDGCPVDLVNITHIQCTDIFNLLDIQPKEKGVDYAIWNVYEPATIGSDDEFYMEAAPGDRLLIDRLDGRTVMLRHYTNARGDESIAESSYVFESSTCEQIKKIMNQ